MAEPEAEAAPQNATTSEEPPERGPGFVAPLCFLSQKTDRTYEQMLLADKSLPPNATEEERADYGVLGKLTGTRPAVIGLSDHRYSVREWRDRNFETQKMVRDAIDLTLTGNDECSRMLRRTKGHLEHSHDQTNAKLKMRLRQVTIWRSLVINAMDSINLEVDKLLALKDRLLKAIMVSAKPVSIARECLSLRNKRDSTELVLDEPQHELNREMLMTTEARDFLQKSLVELDQKITENRGAKQSLEANWSIKTCALNIDEENLTLDKDSIMIMRLGMVRNPAMQTSEETWEAFCTNLLVEVEDTRRRSLEFRKDVELRLLNNARDLREQSENVLRAMLKHIDCVKQNAEKFKLDLQELINLQNENEVQIDDLKAKLRVMDGSMKLVQNRLEKRSFREDNENCRDSAHNLLVAEAQINHTSSTALIEQIKNAEICKERIREARFRLEKELNSKMHALYIDRVRCMEIRALFPTVETLAASS